GADGRPDGGAARVDRGGADEPEVKARAAECDAGYEDSEEARVRALVLLRHGAERLELRLEQRLVDLPLVDRHAFLDAEADHFLPVDTEFLRQLVRREVVCHDAPSGATKKPVRAARVPGSSKLPRSCRRGSTGLPSQNIHLTQCTTRW